MLPILAIISLAFGQAERPPKLDFKEKIDYAAWINAQTSSGKGENALDRYAGFASRRDGKGGMTDGIPSMEGAAREQWSALEGIWTRTDFPELAEYIEQNKKYLDQLTRATEIKCFFDPIDPGSPPLAHLVPYAGPSRWGCKALLAQAWMKDQRQPAALEAAHRVVLRSRSHMQQSGVMLCALVGVSQCADVYRSVRRALDQKVITDADCLRWYQQLEAEDAGGPDWAFHMRIEWALVLSGLQMAFPKGKLDATEWKRVGELIDINNGMSAGDLQILSKSDPFKAVDLINGHFESWIGAVSGPIRWTNSAKIREIRNNLSEDSKAKSNHAASIFVPDLSRAYELFVFSEVERRGTFLTLAIHAHRAKHAEWPEDLGKIDPKLGMKNLKAYRVDPFTGKRFMYKLKDDKPLLYSVGVDGDDDRGEHKVNFGEKSTGGDYVFWPQQSNSSVK